MRKDNALYSDEHGIPEYRIRTYHMDYIVFDSPNTQKAQGKPLGEMKRFVFVEGAEHNAGPGMLYVLDTHSKRIYCGTEMWLTNVFLCQWIVDLKQSDIDELVKKLTVLDVQNWQLAQKNSDDGVEYQIGIEFDDGFIEQHFIKGKDANITELLSFFKSAQTTFKKRILQDRKVTENIDYLVSYLGWDPSRGNSDSEFYIAHPMPLSEPPQIVLDNIDRIVAFKAEEPHEVLDHSRNPQKTLFLDVLNNKLYYEPKKTVYEQISKASIARELEDGEAERIVDLLKDNIAGWKANELYFGDEQAHFAAKMSYTDIPAWCIAIQYKDGTIVHYSGDGIEESGWAPGSQKLLEALLNH